MENPQEKVTKTFPILVVDCVGFLGSRLTSVTSKKALSILVTEAKIKTVKNVIHVPFTKQIPQIPDNIFSHILVFFNGEKNTLQLVSPLAKKARACDAKLLFIMHHELATEALVEKLQSVFPRIQILLYAELFGASEFSNPVQELLQEARRTKTLTLFNNGLITRSPVHINDTIDVILQIADDPNKSGRIYDLSLPYPITDLSVARMLVGHDPNLQIIFAEEKRAEQKPKNLLRIARVIKKTYPLQERLIDAYKSSVASQQKQKRKQYDNPYIQGRMRKGFLIGFGVVIVLIIFTTILPPTIGMISLVASERAFKEARMTDAVGHAQVAKKSFMIAETTSVLPLKIVSFLGFVNTSDAGEKLLHAGETLSRIIYDGAIAARHLQGVFIGTSKAPRQDFLTGISHIKSVDVSMQELILADSLPKDLQDKILMYQKPVSSFAVISDSLVSVLGFEGEKHYLVLFHNNQELRPGGGFIGSYGLVSVKNGKVGELTIHDVYDADGQLKGHIEPPFSYRRYLGVAHWFLRDSNYDPEFIRNAEFAAYLLQLETGDKVDGVIAFDTNVVQSVLDKTGPLYVADFNQTITSDNFVFTTQKHIEDNFLPGSSQKKNFLSSVYSGLLLKFEKTPIPPVDVASLIYKSIQEKHILAAVFDAKIQQVLSAQDVSADLPTGDAKEQSMNDFLAIREANVGANKVNYYVRRAISQNVAIGTDGGITSTVTVGYENTSDKTSPFGGSYKNYMRVFVPQGSSLTEVTIDGYKQQIKPAITDYSQYSLPTFVPPAGIEVDSVAEDGRVGYGLFLEILPKSKKTIRLVFQTPRAVDLSAPVFSYTYTLSKQPGTDQDPYSFLLTIPEGYGITGKTGEGVIQGRQLVASGVLSEDATFSFTAAKQ